MKKALYFIAGVVISSLVWYFAVPSQLTVPKERLAGLLNQSIYWGYLNGFEMGVELHECAQYNCATLDEMRARFLLDVQETAISPNDINYTSP